MKSFVYVLALCTIHTTWALSDEIQELIDMLHKTCQTKTGVAEALIDGARKGKFAEDEPLKCYMSCLLEEMGCLDDEGLVDVEATIAVIPDEYKEVAEPIIKNCGAKKGVTACDNAFLNNKCWQAASPESYFLA